MKTSGGNSTKPHPAIKSLGIGSKATRTTRSIYESTNWPSPPCSPSSVMPMGRLPSPRSRGTERRKPPLEALEILEKVLGAGDLGLGGRILHVDRFHGAVLDNHGIALRAR